MLAWGGIQMADRKDNNSEDRKIPDRQPERLPGPFQAHLPFVSFCGLAILGSGQHWLHVVHREPRGRSLQLVIDVLDVLHAFGLKPLAECGSALLRIYRDTFLPRSAAAEHAVELHASFASQLK